MTTALKPSEVCFHNETMHVGHEADGSCIERCIFCLEEWNEGYTGECSDPSFAAPPPVL